MKYFVALALIAAVVSGEQPTKPSPVTSEVSEIQQIIAAIQSPNSDPASAAVLEAWLQELGIQIPQPNDVDASPIAVGPAIIDFPLPDGGALTEVEASPAGVFPAPAIVAPAPAIVAPAPAIVAPAPADSASSAALVQIILNINSADAAAPAAVGSPVAPAPAVLPGAASIVDVAPVSVVDVAPVSVVDVAPVVVVDQAPEAVIVAQPAFSLPRRQIV